MDKTLRLLEPRINLVKSFKLRRETEKIIISCMFVGTRDKMHGDGIFIKIAEILSAESKEVQKEFEHFGKDFMKVIFCNFMSRSRKNKNKTHRDVYKKLCDMQAQWAAEHKELIDDNLAEHIDCMMKATWRAVVRELERENRFAKFIETDFVFNSNWFYIANRNRKKIDD